MRPLLTLCVVLISLTIGASQDEHLLKVKPFQLELSTVSDTVYLKCKHGCAWEHLFWAADTTDAVQFVNEFGKSKLGDGLLIYDKELANFQMAFQRSQDSIKIYGLQGTHWMNLAFPVPLNELRGINERGFIDFNPVRIK